MATIQESFINLRNDLKTWITNNLQKKANKGLLIASDETQFKFVESDGNYGFYDTNGEFVFLGGGISSAELYNALQYSGLVTEGMTFEEMCRALSKAYMDLTVIDNSTMKTISTLYRGTIGYNNTMYNRQSLSTSNCKFTMTFGDSGGSDGYQWMCTPLIDVGSFNRCDITYSAPLLDSQYNTDNVTVGLSSTAPSGYISTAATTGSGGYDDFTKTGLSIVTSASQNGNNITKTFSFSGQSKLAVVLYFYSNWGVNAGRTKTMQIHKIRFYTE